MPCLDLLWAPGRAEATAGAMRTRLRVASVLSFCALPVVVLLVVEWVRLVHTGGSLPRDALMQGPLVGMVAATWLVLCVLLPFQGRALRRTVEPVAVRFDPRGIEVHGGGWPDLLLPWAAVTGLASDSQGLRVMTIARPQDVAGNLGMRRTWACGPCG